jgi:hypothetical protein
MPKYLEEDGFDKEFEKAKKVFTKTTWKNETKHTARVKLSHNKEDWFKLLPGEEIELSSKYDQAIQRISKEGDVIVGGLCPWLTKVGSDKLPLDPSLDFEAVKEKIELEDLAKKLVAQKSLEEAISYKAKVKTAK